jgi:hypothetical protein
MGLMEKRRRNGAPSRQFVRSFRKSNETEQCRVRIADDNVTGHRVSVAGCGDLVTGGGVSGADAVALPIRTFS